MDQTGDQPGRLAALIKERNKVEVEITAIINRPAQVGHIGEYIAAQVFDISLYDSASNKASDGIFKSGPLAGRSVNVKWYGKQEGILDINPHGIPDYYLVLAGPPATAMSSKGMTRPWVINSVFLFEAAPLVTTLQAASVKIGTAAGVRKALREVAQIYPVQRNPALPLSPTQRAQLSLFREALSEQTTDQP